MTKARELAELSRTIIDTSDATAITINADEEVTLADDLFLADGKKAVFGAGSDLQIYHSGAASFISDQGTGHLKILAGDFRVNNAADDAQFISAVNGAEVNLYHNNVARLSTSATGVAVTGTLSATGVLTVIDGSTSAPSISNAGDSNTGIYFPADDQLGLLVGGSRKLHVTSSGVAIQNGSLTANSGVVVDNITIDGTEIDLSSGDLTIDVAGDITLDADGGDIRLSDGGTQFGKFTRDGGDFLISSSENDKHMKFAGADGGANITALDLDMENAGKATFNAGGVFNDDVSVFGSDSKIYVGESGAGGTFGFLGWNDASNYLFLGNSYNSAFNTDIVISSTGNVGIGLTSGISSKLHVNTEMSLGPDGNNRGIINYSSNILSFGTRQSSTNYFSTVNITGGNVGIGSQQPSRHLTLYKAGSTQTQIQFQNGDTGQTSADGFSIGMDNGKKGFLWGYDDQDIYMGSSTNGTQLYVDNSNSRIGIGTSSPDAKFEVEWTGSQVSTDNVARITAPTYPSLEFYSTNTNSSNRNWKIAGVHNSFGTLEFLRSSSANGTPNVTTLVMNANGHVGIGTHVPEQLLHVHGGNSGSSYNADGADKVIIENSDSVTIDFRTPANAQALILFSDGTRARGLIGYNHSDDTLRFDHGGATTFKLTSTEASFYGPAGNSAPGVVDIYGRNHSSYGSSQVARSRIGSVISGSANAYFTDMVLSTTNTSNVMTERLRLYYTGAVRVNNGFLKLSQDHGIRVFTGFIAGNASANFDVTVYSQGVYEITAAFNHYGYISGYGCARKAICSNGPGVTSGSLSVHDVFSPITSGNGGEWIFGSQSGNNSSVRVTKNAGTYIGGGYYMVRVEGNMGLS